MISRYEVILEHVYHSDSRCGQRGSNALIEQRGVHHFCLWCCSDLFLPLTTAKTRVDLRHETQRCLIHCLFGLWTHRINRLCCKTVLKHDMRSRTGCASLTRLGSKRTIRSWSWLDLGDTGASSRDRQYMTVVWNKVHGIRIRIRIPSLSHRRARLFHSRPAEYYWKQ